MNRVLFFVEDPGAANMLAGLPDALQDLEMIVWAGPQALNGARELGFKAAPPENSQPDVDMFVVGTSENPDTQAFSLIEAARTRSIPSAGLVDGPANSVRRFRGRTDNSLAHAPDWLLVPDQAIARSYEDLGFDPARIHCVGHPALDRVRGWRDHAPGRRALKRKLFPGAGTDQPVLLFLSELSDGLDPASFRRSRDYRLSGRGGADARTRIVLEELLDALTRLDGKPYVALRPHPKERLSEYGAYRSEIDQMGVPGAPLEAVWAADHVVGLSTILLAEATVLGRPTLSILPREVERTWLSTVSLGLTPVAHSPEDIERELGVMLSNRQPAPGVEQVLTFGAPERINRALHAIMERSEPQC